jgi:iron(III) transport system substrate-binding protein
MRAAAAAVLCALLLPAAASARDAYHFPAPDGERQVLTIEASIDISAIEPLIRDFQELEPGITVDFADSLTNDVFAAATGACDAGRSFADLFITSSSNHVVKLANDGCAERYEGDAAALPGWANWRDEAIGFTFEPAVIVYNRDLVPAGDVPRSHSDLIELLRAKPEVYDGRIGTYDIDQSGIGFLFAFFDAEQSSTFGRLLEGLGRARAALRCCTGEILSEIESGKLLIGYNLLGSYAYQRQAAGAPIGIVLPADYTLVLSRAAMIPVHAANPEAGRRFLDYLISPRGRRVAAEKSFYFAFDRAPPQDVISAAGGDDASFYRPIPIGPSLLATLDQAKRERFLAEWAAAMRAIKPLE